MNYQEFEKEMIERGHEVERNGELVTIRPNNNYNGYARGFYSPEHVIEGWEECLDFVSWFHYNDWIYNVTYEINGM